MKKMMRIIGKTTFFLIFACSAMFVQAHVIVQSFIQQSVEVAVLPGPKQSATCTKKFELAPFSRMQLSGGDGTYACKSVLVRVNNQAPQLADFSSIDQLKNNVIIQIIPKETSFNVQVFASAK